MHVTLALLLTAPLGAFASPVKDEARGLDHVIPPWARSWNGKCTSTKSATKTVTSTHRVTKYPLPTITKINVVKTVTTTTTLPTATNVFSTTTTFYETTTDTQSETATETETATITSDVTPPTSYIPAPAGFTPIRSVYPSGGPVIKERDLDARHNKGNAPAPAPTCLKPGDLKCHTTVYTTVTKRTVTRYATTTTTARRLTFTKKRTNTITTTASVLPSPASTTSSFSTTSTIAETVTDTATVTESVTTTTNQVSGPTPTAYAACGPDNILDQYDGGFVDILYVGPQGGSVFLGNQASAYDCCVACLNNPTCAGAGYLGGTCIGLTPDVSCSGNLASGQFGTGSTTDPGWRVSNSGCGQWAYTR